MNCEKCQNYKQNVFVLIWRLIVVLIPYAIVYNWLASQINRLAILFSGQAATMSNAEALSATPVLKPLASIAIPLPDPLAEAYIACVVAGVILYLILDYVCGLDWVKEPVQIKECWEEISWNPLSWIKTVVCTIIESFKWVLKWVCRWKWVVVTGLILVCGVIVTIVILA